jgi:hypothetical protein
VVHRVRGTVSFKLYYLYVCGLHLKSPIQESPEEPWPDLLVDRRPLQQKRVWKSRDPVEVERSNLVAIR